RWDPPAVSTTEKYMHCSNYSTILSQHGQRYWRERSGEWKRQRKRKRRNRHWTSCWPVW
ncbi:hypothetical protein FRC09_002688, partial [Ceratobasidium sp. 395]